MLNNFDDRTLLCAARLLGNDDHTTLIKWLEKEKMSIAEAGMKLQDKRAVCWYQGGFKVLDELINSLKTARQLEEGKRSKLNELPKGELI